jgi:hypothetical protein
MVRSNNRHQKFDTAENTNQPQQQRIFFLVSSSCSDFVSSSCSNFIDRNSCPLKNKKIMRLTWNGAIQPGFATCGLEQFVAATKLNEMRKYAAAAAPAQKKLVNAFFWRNNRKHPPKSCQGNRINNTTAKRCNNNRLASIQKTQTK